MANLPDLTPEDIEKSIPDVTDVERVDSGGQKVVYRIKIKDNTYALKIASAAPDEVPEEDASNEEDISVDVAVARAKREVETMRDCQSAHMVKLGPIGLTDAQINDQNVFYFTEEFVEGQNLWKILRNEGPQPASEIIKLGLQITDAIKALWDLRKVHRDIKPGNIMRRADSGDYVLLDAGFAFDVVGDSLSAGFPVGTVAYFSPEQFDYSARRTGLDYRSDMFSLGVTMYEAATGRHPFSVRGMQSSEIFARILGHNPPPPSTLVQVGQFPEELDDIILQMLGKSSHLRFRTCDRLIEAIRKVG